MEGFFLNHVLTLCFEVRNAEQEYGGSFFPEVADGGKCFSVFFKRDALEEITGLHIGQKARIDVFHRTGEGGLRMRRDGVSSFSVHDHILVRRDQSVAFRECIPETVVVAARKEVED